ncbi:MAG: hypothetical protein CMA03_05525, partial [Euryarchaeota archaeon]|nr:hypothetical protein [Euryarchaeota archaeon]
SNHHSIQNIILGCTEQTDFEGFLKPIIDYVRINPIDNLILTEPQGGRTESIKVEKLFENISSIFTETKIHLEPLPLTALKKGKLLTKKGTLLCIGSLYLIGNILSILELDDENSMTILSK